MPGRRSAAHADPLGRPPITMDEFLAEAEALGAIVLHEALPAWTVIGGGCILVSTWMVVARPARL